MRGMLIAIGALVIWTGTAHAQQDLQNDGFVSPMSVGFQGGFVAGEMGASRFVASAPTQQLLRVRFLFGGAMTTRTITLNVYDDSGGAVAPGTALFTGDYDVAGNNMVLHEIDLSTDNVIVPQQFRVAIQFTASGYPCIARDDDGSNTANRNFLFGDIGLGQNWYSTTGLVPGDWIIRATVSTGGGTIDAAIPIPDADPAAPDADPTAPDGPPSGGMCLANTECPVGQYCHPTNMTCTFDCREDTDCSGSDTCNSLGQCVEGEGGGGCCRTDRGGGAASALFALGMLVLLVRRRQ